MVLCGADPARFTWSHDHLKWSYLRGKGSGGRPARAMAPNYEKYKKTIKNLLTTKNLCDILLVQTHEEEIK